MNVKKVSKINLVVIKPPDCDNILLRLVRSYLQHLCTLDLFVAFVYAKSFNHNQTATIFRNAMQLLPVGLVFLADLVSHSVLEDHLDLHNLSVP